MSAVIFSDLDGTLLDHDTYDPAAALPTLQRVQHDGHAVVLNTSKTATETARWHQQLHLHGAYIVENGAAIHAPDGSLLASQGMARDTLLSALHEIRLEHDFQFCGFSDTSIEQIVAWTGLDWNSAERASQRCWSEPLKWLDEEAAIPTFRACLKERGLQLLRGGRFWHVQGQHDKASALRQLSAIDHPAVTVALGDGENDVAMIQAADIGVLVRSPAHDFPELTTTPRQLIRTTEFGPAGWAEAINTIIEKGWFNT